MKIVDCFIFGGERELLIKRLEYLIDVVDEFVIVESPFSFQGKFLGYNFDFDLIKSEFRSKITYFPLSHLWPTENPWENEISIRNSINECLTELSKGDLILISDLDEIPREETLIEIRQQTLQNKFEYEKLIAFSQDRIYWDIHLRCTEQCIGTVGYFFNGRLHEPQSLRMLAHKFSDKNQILYIDNSGYHFSNISGIKFIKRSIKKSSHKELDTFFYRNRITIFLLSFIGIDWHGNLMYDFVPKNNLPTQFESLCQRSHIFRRYLYKQKIFLNARIKISQYFQKKSKAKLTVSGPPAVGSTLFPQDR